METSNVIVDIPTSINNSDIPPEFKALHGALYKKISGLVAGTHVIDIRNDPTTLRVIIESAMSIVEDFGGADKKVLSGPEKKRIALTLAKCVITDLGNNGKIDSLVAQEINSNVDFWGGITMDVAVDATKIIFQIGQKVATDVGVFTEDAQKVGCSQACKKDCCIIF